MSAGWSPAGGVFTTSQPLQGICGCSHLARVLNCTPDKVFSSLERLSLRWNQFNPGILQCLLDFIRMQDGYRGSTLVKDALAPVCRTAARNFTHASLSTNSSAKASSFTLGSADNATGRNPCPQGKFLSRPCTNPNSLQMCSTAFQQRISPPKIHLPPAQCLRLPAFFVSRIRYIASKLFQIFGLQSSASPNWAAISGVIGASPDMI